MRAIAPTTAQREPQPQGWNLTFDFSAGAIAIDKENPTTLGNAQKLESPTIHESRSIYPWPDQMRCRRRADARVLATAALLPTHHQSVPFPQH